MRYHRENIWVLQLNIAESEKNIIVYYALRGCEQYESKKSTLSHETKVQF